MLGMLAIGMGEHKSYEIRVEEAAVLIGPETQLGDLREVYKEPLEGTPVYEAVDGKQYAFEDEESIMEMVDPPFAGVFRFVEDWELETMR